MWDLVCQQVYGCKEVKIGYLKLPALCLSILSVESGRRWYRIIWWRTATMPTCLPRLKAETVSRTSRNIANIRIRAGHFAETVYAHVVRSLGVASDRCHTTDDRGGVPRRQAEHHHLVWPPLPPELPGARRGMSARGSGSGMLVLGLFDANIGRILGVFVKDPRILIMGVFCVFWCLSKMGERRFLKAFRKIRSWSVLFDIPCSSCALGPGPLHVASSLFVFEQSGKQMGLA